MATTRLPGKKQLVTLRWIADCMRVADALTLAGFRVLTDAI